MVVSVIDTRREFKLVPYSGDDEHLPQWVVKFEVRSELVGWSRQLDAAAASTLPIVNTTLEAEVQKISRQLYAIPVVKLEGKALGIVQLVNKGEGLEAWRQLNNKYEGKSWNRKVAWLRGILKPRAACEADTRDGRSVVESLNRWEKIIGLYRTASQLDISDGILAATVLEYSPESYQIILKQAPSNVRASYSAMRGWLREYAETLREYDGTSGSSSHQTQSIGPVPMEVDQTRAVSGFSSGKDGKGKSKGKGKDGKGKGKGKKGDKSKDQKPISKLDQFQGHGGYYEKWRHKRADCRKRIAGGKSRDSAAAASADNDGDVAAVMEVDDTVMGTGADETSTCWCFAVASVCAAVGSTGSLFLDSGSDEHLCTPKFADLIPTGLDRSSSSKMCN